MKQVELLNRLSTQESELFKVSVLDTMLTDFNYQNNFISLVNLNTGVVYSSKIFIDENGTFDNHNSSIKGWILALSNLLLKKEFDLKLEGNKKYLNDEEIFKLLKNQENQNFTNNKCHLNFFFTITKNDEIYGFTSEKISLPNKYRLHNWLTSEFEKRFGEINVNASLDLKGKPVIDYLLPKGMNFRIEYGLDTGWSNYKFGYTSDDSYFDFDTWFHNQSKKSLKQKLERYINVEQIINLIKGKSDEKKYQFA